MTITNQESLILQWNDTNVEITEQITIVNKKAVLSQIPDKFMRISITGYAEIENEIPGSGQFVCDYQTGILTFSNDVVDGTAVSANFYGRGIIMYPASRIYAHNTDPDVVTNIQDMIDNYNQLNGTDLYDLFDPNNGHKHTGAAGEAPKIPAQYIPLSDVANIITATNVEDALQELKSDANNNSDKVGNIAELETRDKSSLVNSVNENVSEIKNRQIENIGFGVQTGLEVTASTTPDMNVHVQTGVVYMPDGKRFQFTTVNTITITTADASNPRKDIIYVSTDGVITYISGFASTTPTEPSVPSGAIKLCVIDVPTNDTEVESTQIIDTRGELKRNLSDRIDENDAEIGDTSTLNTSDQSNLVNAINENVAQLSDIVSKIKGMKNNVERIAHRGYSGLAPESTIAAIREAIKYGFDSLEFDIQISSDGQPVIIHDLTVDRTTNGTGNVKDFTLSQLQSLDAGSWFSPIYTGVKIPTLSDVLREAKGKFLNIYPEIKDYVSQDDITTMVQTIINEGFENNCVIASADFTDFSFVRSLSARMVLGYLVGEADQFANALMQATNDGNAVVMVRFPVMIENPTFVDEARGQGVDVVVWTPNNTDDIAKLNNIGIVRTVSDFLREVI